MVAMFRWNDCYLGYILAIRGQLEVLYSIEDSHGYLEMWPLSIDCYHGSLGMMALATKGCHGYSCGLATESCHGCLELWSLSVEGCHRFRDGALHCSEWCSM